MRLRVLHQTHYHYASPVDVAQHQLHLRPRDTPCQTVLRHSLSVSPTPDTRLDTLDTFGNHRQFLALQVPHRELRLDADSEVEVRPPEPLAAAPCHPAWEAVRERFRYRAGVAHDPAIDFRFHTPATPMDEAFLAFAWPVLESGLGVLDLAQALMGQIHRQLRYDPGSTQVNTPTLQALAQRSGVCQDFAHLMIACWRNLGLPARYVSGYLLTQPPPGQPRLIGADASHAWASVYVPDLERPGHGFWADFDPTNHRSGIGSPGEDYITLAWGREFLDVSPVRGVIQGGGGHRLSVGVTVAPPEQWPAAAA